MKVCPECGKRHNENFANNLCQTCYRYFRDGGTVNPIPPNGRIEYDVNGKIVCHICGRAYTRLGSHIKESHNMTIKEYKEKFGLCASARTTADNYSNKMRNHAYNNDMDKQLIESGKNTRFKKGDGTARKDKQVRLQEILNKKDRKPKETKQNSLVMTA